MFTEKASLYTFLGLIQSHSGILGDIEGFIQNIPGSYKSEKLNNFTRIDKVQCDCINGSILDCCREPNLFSFDLHEPTGHKFLKTKKKTFKKLEKSVLSHNTFYLEDGDHKLVDFNGETISLTCQLIQI